MASPAQETITVKVLYFAKARELATISSETLTLLKGTVISTLVAEVVRLHPGLKPLELSCAIAVNLEYIPREEDGAIKEDEALEDGDEIAIIPPVSGG